MKRKVLLLIFCCCMNNLSATHLLGGEITYRCINVSTRLYEISINVYACSDTLIQFVDINVGDGNTYSLNFFPDTAATGFFNCRNCIAIKRKAVVTHSYSSPGVFNLHLAIPSRVDSIMNIPNSVNVPLYLQTTLTINPFTGVNDSPVFTYAPLGEATVGGPFTYNGLATDADGDSLSYVLEPCVGAPGYFYPPASTSFSINSVTGDLTWDSPLAEGYYSVGINVVEWRNGNVVGFVYRDMIISVCQSIGFEEENTENNFSLFPNPATTELKFNTAGFKIDGIKVYDVLGKLKYSIKTDNHSFTGSINVSAWSNGIYFVRVKSDEGIKSLKVLVQH